MDTQVNTVATDAANAEQMQLSARIIEEALTWVGTPYILGGHLKGVGCDCCTLLIEVFCQVGLIQRAEIEAEMKRLGLYTHDWFCHTTEEKYLRTLLKFAIKEIETRCYPTTKALPGNIILTKAFGSSKRWNHGGIVLKWPKIIHAVTPSVCITDASRDPMWAFCEVGVFSVGKV